jgi:2Fe-2S ferredoxin
VPTIEFQASVAGAAKTVEVPAGGELVDICDQHLAPVPFSCRSASCATCQIHVVEGADLFEKASEEEQDLLDILGAGPEHRLACQARVKAGSGRIVLKSVGG